eukprot:7478-Prymnesium_polylepis.1
MGPGLPVVCAVEGSIWVARIRSGRVWALGDELDTSPGAGRRDVRTYLGRPRGANRPPRRASTFGPFMQNICVVAPQFSHHTSQYTA